MFCMLGVQWKVQNYYTLRVNLFSLYLLEKSVCLTKENRAKNQCLLSNRPSSVWAEKFEYITCEHELPHGLFLCLLKPKRKLFVEQPCGRCSISHETIQKSGFLVPWEPSPKVRQFFSRQKIENTCKIINAFPFKKSILFTEMHFQHFVVLH